MSPPFPPLAAASRPYLAPLDGLRFLAALHIVALHTLRAAWLPAPVARFAGWGSSTTSFFFLLSGFVLTHAYAGADGRLRTAAGEFRRRRIARLYPLAVVGHLMAAPLVWTAYGDGVWVRAAVAFTGTQAWFPPFANVFDTPAWVISVLLFFSLVFPGLLRTVSAWDERRLRGALVALWALMLLPPALHLAVGAPPGFWASFVHAFPLCRLAELVFGMALARLYALRGWPRAPAWMAPAALVLLLAAILFAPQGIYPLARTGLFAPLHAAVIWGMARSTGPVARVMGARWVRPLGDASFALFLLHVPVYAWMVHLWWDRVEPLGRGAGIAFYAVFVALAVVLSLAAERWVARPVEARLRGWGRGMPARAGNRPGG